MAATGSPTVRRRRLAAELRRLRGNHRTGGQVAKALGWSPAKISRYELGQGGFPLDEVAKLLDFYGVTEPRRTLLMDLAADANARGWWEDYADVLTPEYTEYIGLEAEAQRVLAWSNYVVPGLLQTEEYARQLNVGYNSVIPTPPGVLERLVEVRMTRQELLKREDPPFRLSVVVDESVLQRQVGDPALMRAQLRHLAEVASLPSVELRVLTMTNGSSLVSDSFTIFKFESWADLQAGRMADVVSTESVKSQVVEPETETHLYSLVFDGLSDASLSPSESADLIMQTASNIWT